MLKANGWWDEYWTQQRNAWRERARSFRPSEEHQTDLAKAA